MNVNTIAENLLFTTVRIEAIHNNGNVMTGTGFFFDYSTSDGVYSFIVTNKHVVAGATSGLFTFTEANDGQPVLGKVYRLTVTDLEKWWFGHPDPAVDVAVVPLAPLEDHIKETSGIDLFYRSVGMEIALNEGYLANIDAIEDVIFVGYPSGIWDTVNYLPLIRQGITASPIAVDFDGQPKFLIDASVFPGSSGSPVFLYSSGTFRANKAEQNTFSVGTRLMLLGILAAVHFRAVVNEVQLVEPAAQKVPVTITKEMLNLGIVFKASTIVETIEALLKRSNPLRMQTANEG